MSLTERIIWSDNGVLKDISRQVSDFYSIGQVLPIVAAEDYLYIGSTYPFNHRYIRMNVNNIIPSNMSLSYWDGDEWKPVVEVIDETSSSGATLGASGLLQWVPDKDYDWCMDDTNYNGTVITGLSGIVVYDLYWLRIQFSADITPTTRINFIGHKFSNDSLLGGIYPDLLKSDVLTAFQAAKTNWDDQHLIASLEVVKDLQARGILMDRNQVLDPTTLALASCHKVAALIYNSFGEDFVDERKIARDQYLEIMRSGFLNVDRNKNARLNPRERRTTTGWLSR